MRANARQSDAAHDLNLRRMIVDLQNVIQALRNELHQYGEMLALLDQQHHLAEQSGADEILRSISHINHQSASIRHARERRQTAQRQLATALQQPAVDTFYIMFPL